MRESNAITRMHPEDKTWLVVGLALMYGIRLSHIFEIPSISNEKRSISIEILSISN